VELEAKEYVEPGEDGWDRTDHRGGGETVLSGSFRDVVESFAGL
jgi:hypothetical protein